MRRLLLIVSMLSFCGFAYAEEVVQAEEPKSWKSDMELGFVQTGGNTKTQTLNAKGKVVWDGDAFRTTVEATALSSKDGKLMTSERYTAAIQEDWKISEIDYLFGRIGFSTDRFDGYKRRVRETIGYGRDLIKNDDLHWKAEIGAGLRQTTLVTNVKENDAIGRGATVVVWKINEAATFTQDLSTEGGKKGFVSNSVTSLQQKLNGRLATKLSFSAQHTSKVPVGTKKVNTETAITLVWSY
jgi:putative salt-induced outer membrane protein